MRALIIVAAIAMLLLIGWGMRDDGLTDGTSVGTAPLQLVDAQGQAKTADGTTGDLTAYYFSASWCPPCRGFTPKLVDFHADQAERLGLEVVLVSADRDQASMLDYMQDYHMPFAAVSKADQAGYAWLDQAFGVRSIPALIVLDADGQVVADSRALGSPNEVLARLAKR